MVRGRVRAIWENRVEGLGKESSEVAQRSDNERILIIDSERIQLESLPQSPGRRHQDSGVMNPSSPEPLS